MIEVYVGGFASSKRESRYVADALAEFYGQDRHDVTSLSFADAMNQKDRTRDIVRGKDVLTHSAGTLSVQGAEYDTLTSIAPPIPTSRVELVVRSALKTFRMTRDAIGDRGRLGRVMNVNRNQTGELLLHPYANIRHIGAIAAYSCVESAVLANPEYERLWFGFMNDDAFGYTISDKQRRILDSVGVATATIPGVHDQLLLYPQKTIADFEKGLID